MIADAQDPPVGPRKGLADPRELAEAVVEAAPDALLVIDGAGLIVSANARSEELFGYPRAELVGRHVELLVPRSVRELHRGRRAAFLEAPTVRPMAEGRDLTARTRDGSELSVQISLSPIHVRGDRYVVAAVRRTPEHAAALQRTHEALRASEERLHQLIEDAPEALFVADLEGHYTEVNAAACKLLGYTREELLQKTISDLIPPEDVPRLTAVRGELLEPGHVDVAEWTLVRKDGMRIPVEVSAKVLEGGRWQAFVRDLTERKRLEVALSARDRLITVGTLAAGVGHEINNPLVLVTLNLDLAVEEIRNIGGASPPGRFRDLLETLAGAREGAERIRKIVRGLHTFARGDREERTEVDLRTALDLSIGLTQHELRRRSQVVRDFRPVPLVLADESRLAQVFINLLMNAAQAMEHRPLERNIISVSTWTDQEGRAVAEVRDNGPGMTAEVRARLFEPFFTTKPIGKGTGLGLSIAYNIVTALGGEISCDTRPDEGATFRVTLPAGRESSIPFVPDARSGQKDSRRGRVLIVDDEPAVAASLERVLSGDHDVDVAEDGIAAWSRLSKDPRYDVVICDLMMPRMNGMELFERVARERPELAERFVFTTGGATNATAHAFLESVPNERLEKPFSVPNLRALVRRTVDSHDPPSQDGA